MKIAFVSNYFNHHQKYLADALFKYTNGEFVFIATREMSNERKSLGWHIEEPQYVMHAYESNDSWETAKGLIDDADVAIFGSAPEKIIKNRIKKGRIVFRYTERPFKSKKPLYRHLLLCFKLIFRNFNRKNVFLLCASAFTYNDYKKLGLFKNRAYKWGYFPKIERLESEVNKKQNAILWCGRFVDWKNVNHAIEVAHKLKKNNYKFKLNIIGAGQEENALMELVELYSLHEQVTFLGSMTPDEVRGHMLSSGVYIFTSNKKEGWGAVLNESMNSACAVVASHEIGSTPFLIEDGVNGFIYESENIEMLYDKVAMLLDDPKKQKEIGNKAYHTILKEWNADEAAVRFIKISTELLNHKNPIDYYKTGPCSRAEIVREIW